MSFKLIVEYEVIFLFVRLHFYNLISCAFVRFTMHYYNCFKKEK